MHHRVYGVVGIRCIMANWNADFTGRPKMTGNGNIFGSDKAFKYPIRKMWEEEGERILYIKSYKLEGKGRGEEKLQPRELRERYELIFSPYKIDKSTSSREILRNLFSAMDVMNFGATFAEESQNISITGAVQIGQGYNKYTEASIESQDVLSPFRNAKKDEANASSMGTKSIVDEAHYFYPFSVNPDNYKEYKSIIEGFNGYSAEAYSKFKKACLVAATAFNTNSKMGCENEFAIFIVCKENAKLYLPNLDQFVKYRKVDGKGEIDITGLDFITGFKDKITKIELYFDSLNTVIKTNLRAEGLNYEERDIFNNPIVNT